MEPNFQEFDPNPTMSREKWLHALPPLLFSGPSRPTHVRIQLIKSETSSVA
jgi:hypothetical protein